MSCRVNLARLSENTLQKGAIFNQNASRRVCSRNVGDGVGILQQSLTISFNYTLAGPDVAHAVEALGAIATLPRPSAAPQSQSDLEIRKARSCCDHLAGRIAVEMVKALETSQVIRISGDRDYELGPNGRSWFSNLGIDTDALQRSRRSFARQCLDWTERRPHLAGALGAELCARTLALSWFAKQRNKRALRVTHKGTRELHARFGISA